MTTYRAHDWVIFANTVVESKASVVVTAVCQRCGDVRSTTSSTIGHGHIDLTGECDSEGETQAAVG
jgi:hypothetical protein